MLGFFAWLVLLAATAVLAELAFPSELAHIPAAFLALPPPQRVAVGLIALMALALMASTLWQSWRISRQEKNAKALHGGPMSAQRAMAAVGGSQRDFDAAVQHLVKSDPEEAISTLQKQLAETEARAAQQRGRNEAVDMRERLDDIRRRQQALREQIGEVAEKRRIIEPGFEELKDRQRQLDRSLDKIETDDDNNNLADRLKEFDQKVALLHERHKTLQDSFTALTRFKEELTRSQAELVPLQAQEGGIKALLAELQGQRDRLAKAVEELETSDSEKLSSRVEALDSGKKDAEQRVVRLEGSYAILDTIRRDFIDLGKRQEDLRLAFAEVETDASGKSLADRLGELDKFSAETRGRLRTLQEALTTLNRYRRDLVNSQTELAPLQAPGEGVNALLEELNTRRCQLITALDELESSGGEKLGSKVESLADSKLATEQRIAQVYQHFERLESIRSDIAKTFENLSGALNKLG
jgi:DNA repair exonuclease SbcCD ATPase subunit